MLSAFDEFMNLPLPSFAGGGNAKSPKSDTSTADFIHASPLQHFTNGDGHLDEGPQQPSEGGSFASVSSADHPLLNPNQHVIKYEPPPTCKLFHDDETSFVRLLMGPIGSGKSSSCCMELIMQAFRQSPGPDGIRRTRYAVVRQSYPQLITTTMKTWHEWSPGDVWKTKLSAPPTTQITQLLEDGTQVDCEILWLALELPQDTKKLLSLELSGAWINEAREIPREIFDLIQGRIGRWPSTRLGGVDREFLICDSNPPDRSHWLAQIFTDPPDGFKMYSQPSGMSPEGENLSHLPENYYQRLMSAKSKGWIDSYIHGRWGNVADGKSIWGDDFDQDMHVLKEHPEVPSGSSLCLGLDFGLTPALTVGFPQADGTLLICGEMISERAGILSFANDMKLYLASEFPNCSYRIVADPAGNAGAQTDERTPFEILAGLAIQAEPASTNEIDQRIESVRIMLLTMVRGKAWIRFSPRCIHTIASVAGNYRYRRLQVGGEAKYSATPDKNAASHIADSLQYLCLSFSPAEYAGKLQHAANHGYDIDMSTILKSPIDMLMRPKGFIHPLDRQIKTLFNHKSRRTRR